MERGWEGANGRGEIVTQMALSCQSPLGSVLVRWIGFGENGLQALWLLPVRKGQQTSYELLHQLRDYWLRMLQVVTKASGTQKS